MRKILLIIAVFLVTILLVQDLSATGSGRTGRTRKTNTTGCSCHNSSPSTSINATFSGPDSVNTGATVTYTLTITGGSSGYYGIDVAIKNGTLAAGTNTHLASSEITHNSNVSSNTFTFSYTAPATAGTDTLYATVDRGYSGVWNWVPNKGIKVKSITSVSQISELVTGYKLSQNYPNPFNPTTKIEFSITKASNVSMKIYNTQGVEVMNAVNSYMNAGTYSVSVDASALPSGVYFYKLSSENFTQTKRMILVK